MSETVDDYSPKHIYFECEGTSVSGKTKVWSVKAKDGNMFLGEIRWYGPWRRYCFVIDKLSFEDLGEPIKKLVYEWVCMRSIADFCEKMTKEQREKKVSE